MSDGANMSDGPGEIKPTAKIGLLAGGFGAKLGAVRASNREEYHGGQRGG
jgi:hypothetical protein